MVWNADRRARIGLELEEGLVCFDRGDACKLVTYGGGFGLLTEEPGAVGRRDAIKRGAWILAPDEDVTQRARKENSKNSTNSFFELNGNKATQDLRIISSFACPILS